MQGMRGDAFCQTLLERRVRHPQELPLNWIFDKWGMFGVLSVVY